MVTFLDDATRLILHGEFYPTLDQVIIEDCFRKAIQKYGVPSRLLDNQPVQDQMDDPACAKMGMRLLYAARTRRVSGKLNRFNRVVDSFLNESVLETSHRPAEPTVLVWLEECYQHNPTVA